MTVVDKPLPKASDVIAEATNDPLAQPRFTTAQVAAAAGMPAETLRTWFKRGVLSLDDDFVGEAPSSIGFGRHFTGYLAMTVAIMAPLIAGGMPALAAKRAAYAFVHAGHDKRRPCHPFEDGRTVLLIPKNTDLPIRVINLSDTDPESWSHLLKFGSRRVDQVEVFLVDELWSAVFQKLGLREGTER